MKRPRENEEKYYVVQKIVNSRMSKGYLEYQVKWWGWAQNHSTWEPLSNLTQCLRQVFRYQRQKLLKHSRHSSVQSYQHSHRPSILELNQEYSAQKSSSKHKSPEQESANQDPSQYRQGVSISSKGSKIGKHNIQGQWTIEQMLQSSQAQAANQKRGQRRRLRKKRISESRSDSGTFPSQHKMTDSLANKLNGLLENIRDKPRTIPQNSSQKALQQLTFPQLRSQKGLNFKPQSSEKDPQRQKQGVAVILEAGSKSNCQVAAKKVNPTSNLKPLPVSMEYKGLQGLSCTYIVYFSDGSSKVVDSAKLKQDYLSLYVHYLQNTKFPLPANSIPQSST